jgi:sugar lactone lactonase YvrE
MKKNQKLILLLLLIAILAFILLKVFVWGLGPQLDKPESVAFDPVGNRFLISNVGSGSIIAMDEDGKFHKYMPKAFKAPKGILLKDDMLYVTDPTQVHVVDVSEATIIDSYAIEGAVALNDIAISEHGLLYLTDSGANCVFIYDPASRTQEKVISPLLQSPNGIVYDRPRWQMFIVNNAERSPILSLDVRDKNVSIFMDSVYSNLDGIAIDDLGRIYFSSWKEEMIIEIPQEQNRFISKYENLKGAADFYYHLPTNELIVPLLSQNKIERISLD